MLMVRIRGDMAKWSLKKSRTLSLGRPAVKFVSCSAYFNDGEHGCAHIPRGVPNRDVFTLHDAWDILHFIMHGWLTSVPNRERCQGVDYILRVCRLS